MASKSWRVLTCAVAASLLAASAAAATVVVKQKGRQFNPSEVEVSAGDTVRIINDDGDLLHHAYLEDPAFSFDIGEQEPDQVNDIVFPVAGTFNVFCGIHPKMRLVVTVK